MKIIRRCSAPGRKLLLWLKLLRENIKVSLRMDYVEGTHTSPVGYVEGLYIKPGFRQQGLGLQLLMAAEFWCKEKGCVEMASDTEVDNELSQIFHRKAGFTEVRQIVCFKKELR